MSDLTDRKLKRGGLTGLVVGALALLVCELPIVLAMVGFGTVAGVLHSRTLILWVEGIGLVSAAIGLMLLARLGLRRWRHVTTRNAQGVE